MTCLNRKIFFLTFSTLLICFYLTAQDSFVKQIEHSISQHNCSSEISSDSGLVICGFNEYPEASLVKVNKYGMINWAISCMDDSGMYGSFFYCSTKLNDRIYAGGQINGYSYLFKCDFNGQKIFSKTFSPILGNYWDNVVAITNDSVNLYLICVIHFQATLIKADTLGNVIWCKNFSFPLASDILFDYSSKSVVISTAVSEFSTTSYLTSLDTSGNIQWQKFYPSFQIQKISATKNGNGYLLGGKNSAINDFYTFISKTDNSGTIIWTRLFVADSTIYFDPSVYSLYSANDGSIYFGNSTSTQASITAPPVYIKLDSSGNVMWGKYFTPPAYIEAAISSFVEPSQGHFYITAEEGQYGIIISTDTSANPDCDFLTFIPRDTIVSFQDSATFLPSQPLSLIVLNASDSVNSISFTQFFDCSNSIQTVANPTIEINVFPNPATTEITFKMGDLNGNKTLIICDQLGKEIWRKESTENQIEFSTENFSAGLYFYHIEQNAEIKATGKLIIE